MSPLRHKDTKRHKEIPLGEPLCLSAFVAKKKYTPLICIMSIVKKTFFISPLVLSVYGCRSFLKTPALPAHKMPLEQEIKYIYDSDQKDQRHLLLKFIFLSSEKQIKNKKILAFSKRDSLRLSRIKVLDDSIKEKDYDSKYYAAFIYIHGGGINSGNDSLSMKKGYEFFKEVYEHVDKKRLSESMMHEAYNRWQYTIKKE